ncbi:hypothetical protein PtA15_3A39 [Puccinia triticina]|uniref:Uncharacterized protein n=1 Tax=Puccinia triticina TaxID=208348 RepID=A0ABY7CEU3_9BASI|nr:uncharacterized protein PtA15_3A39 [Puccinia triticina]WAQ82676.1 hypothetical protein PtA15_3A39 [Puccinia triticina]
MTTSLRKKYNRIKLKITKQNAAQLQAQLGAQLHSQLLPKIDLRNLENKQLLRTCSALKLQIFKILVLWKVLKVAIHVVQLFHPSIKISHKFLKPRDSKALTISYHHKLCGL